MLLCSDGCILEFALLKGADHPISIHIEMHALGEDLLAPRCDSIIGPHTISIYHSTAGNLQAVVQPASSQID